MPTIKEGEPAEAAAALRAARQLAAEQLALDQRDANEQLLLAGIRARDAADEASAGRTRAEDATRALQVSERELRATGEFREQLLGIVGHDLRNPLGAIAMAAKVLLAHDKLDPTDAHLVGRIVYSCQRMSRMIEELLDFTRTRLGGGLALRLVPVDLAEVCRHAVSELDLVAPSPLRCELSGDLRGAWDGERLYQVLSNLVANALDYATPGTAVVVRAFPAGEEVVVEIANQGIPIAPEVLPTLFEPFRRANREHAGKHLGLGLYIANQIVLAHGGTLGARSEAGTTTFTLRLPRPA